MGANAFFYVCYFERSGGNKLLREVRDRRDEFVGIALVSVPVTFLMSFGDLETGENVVDGR